MSESPTKGFSFPKSARLRRRSEFLKVQESGTKVSSQHLLGLALRRDASAARVGFTVSSKVGPSVVRNRVRRRLREIYRKRQGMLPPGVELVFIAKQSAAHADSTALTESVEAILRKLRSSFP